MRYSLLFIFVILILTGKIAAQETPVIIKDKNFTLLFPTWKLDSNYFEIHQKADSTFLKLEEGETPEEKVFKFTKSLKIIEITQHYRTTLSISDEGSHWDLFDWKHFVSQKTLLTPKAGDFTILRYSEDQRNIFPDYREKELLTYVKNHSPKALEIIYKDKVISRESLYKSISEIYLTIKYINPNSSQVLKRVIVFHLPLGC